MSRPREQACTRSSTVSRIPGPGPGVSGAPASLPDGRLSPDRAFPPPGDDCRLGDQGTCDPLSSPGIGPPGVPPLPRAAGALPGPDSPLPGLRPDPIPPTWNPSSSRSPPSMPSMILPGVSAVGNVEWGTLVSTRGAVPRAVSVGPPRLFPGDIPLIPGPAGLFRDNSPAPGPSYPAGSWRSRSNTGHISSLRMKENSSR